MSKKQEVNFSKRYPGINRLALYTTLIALLGVATLATVHYMGRKKARREVARLTAEIEKNNDAKHTYVMTASEFASNRILQRKLDSLANRNSELTNRAQEKYFTRINNRYNFGRFFTPNQIAKLNQIVMPYANKFPKTDSERHAFIRKNTPLKSKTTIPAFEKVITILNVPAEKFAPMDMIVSDGKLYMFNDPKQQKTFESYLMAIDAAFINSDKNEPNFAIREFAPMEPEHTTNKHEISALSNEIQANDFLISQTLAEYGRINDSLNTLINKYQQKLK